MEPQNAAGSSHRPTGLSEVPTSHRLHQINAQKWSSEFRVGPLGRGRLERAGLAVTKHVIARIDLCEVGGSAPTADIDVPKGRSTAHMSDRIPVTYVPARSRVFLSFRLAWAETLGA